MSHTYIVTTMEFGDLLYVANSIGEARTWARKAHRVGPESVRRQKTYRRCETCESAPCACR